MGHLGCGSWPSSAPCLSHCLPEASRLLGTYSSHEHEQMSRNAWGLWRPMLSTPSLLIRSIGQRKSHGWTQSPWEGRYTCSSVGRTWQKAHEYREGWGIGVNDTVYQILIFRVIVLLLYNFWTEPLYFAGHLCNERIKSQDHFKNGIIW